MNMTDIAVITEPKTHLDALLPILPNGKIDARQLHQFLGVQQQFKDWISRRIDKYDFIEGIEYDIVDYDVSAAPKRAAGILEASEAINLKSGANKTDYQISIGMAKELGMLENSEKGKQIRKYFIAVEAEAYRQQEAKHQLALSDYKSQIKTLSDRNGRLDWEMNNHHRMDELRGELSRAHTELNTVRKDFEKELCRKASTRKVEARHLSDDQRREMEVKVERKLRKEWEEHGVQAVQLRKIAMLLLPHEKALQTLADKLEKESKLCREKRAVWITIYGAARDLTVALHKL